MKGGERAQLVFETVFNIRVIFETLSNVSCQDFEDATFISISWHEHVIFTCMQFDKVAKLAVLNSYKKKNTNAMATKR